MLDLNTAKFEALATLTGVRTDINDMEWRWLYSEVAPFKGSIQDMWAEFYRINGYEDRKEFLTDVLGSFDDAGTSELAYWAQGGGALHGTAIIGMNLSAQYAWVVERQADEDIAYLKSMRVIVARLQIGLERFMPVLNGTPDEDYCDFLHEYIAALWAQGIATVLEFHNFGRYDPDFCGPEGSPPGNYDHGAPGAHADSYVLGDDDFPISALADAFGKLCVEFGDDPGMVGAGPMNEPHDLPSPNLIGAPNNFVSGQFWFNDFASVTQNAVTGPYGDMDGSLVTNGAGGYGSMGWAHTFDSGDSYAYAVWGRRHNNVAATLTASLGGSWVQHSLTNTWQLLGEVRVATGAEDAFRFFVEEASVQVELAWAQMQKATEIVDIGGPNASTWLAAAQACIDEARGEGYTGKILVNGIEYGNIASWADSDILKGLVDPLNNTALDTHYYMDVSGAYNDDYDDLALTPTSGAEQVADFIQWLADNPTQRTIVGETAVPGDDPRFLTSWATAAALFDAAGVPIFWHNYYRHMPSDPEWWPSDTVHVTKDDEDQSRMLYLKSIAVKGPFAWPA